METRLEKLAEIRNERGGVIWSVWMNPQWLSGFGQTVGQGESPDVKHTEQEGPGQGPGSNDVPMTDAQKRYLFRLLADRGIEGEAAHRHLKEAFGVDSLGRITKFEASNAIDRMLNG